MSMKKVLIVDNDNASIQSMKRVVEDNDFSPQLIIGLEQLEPFKGLDGDVQRIEMGPDDFPPLAFVADYLGGILTPAAEIMGVLKARNVCCIATTITKQQTLSIADFGINKLDMINWVSRWLQPIYALASNQEAVVRTSISGRRKILIVHPSVDTCLSTMEGLRRNDYPCVEPIMKVTHFADGVLSGRNHRNQKVDVALDELAVLFADAPLNENSDDSISAKDIIRGAKGAGVCCVTTSVSKSGILPEADFMIDETQRRNFAERWMRAIYPTACKTLSKG
jgi:hypothetical protein